jgi:hypothetical protein
MHGLTVVLIPPRGPLGLVVGAGLDTALRG